MAENSGPTARSKRHTPSTELAAILRGQIVSGYYQPGERLPARAELREQFQSTAATIQRTFDILQAQGFVIACGRAGSFVAEHPPHLSHYVLVLEEPPRPGRPVPQFWRALEHELNAISDQAGDQRRFSIHYAPHDTDSIARFEELNRLVELDEVAGLIFANAPHSMAGSPAVERPGIPRVIMASGTDLPDVALVRLRGFLRRAVDVLAEKGRRRVGLLVAPRLLDVEAFDRMVASRGMTSPPRWQQAIQPSQDPQWSRNLVQLLVQGPPGERPDGLIIADDNIVPGVTDGLQQAGIAVDEELTVVAHANFPLPTTSHVPAIRVGYDARAILTAAVEWIDARRRGEQPPDEIIVEAIADDAPPGPDRGAHA